MSNVLNVNQQLGVNQRLDALNNKCHLTMQADGNLVLYRNDTGQPLWASNTWGRPANHAIMQTDGNFVVYDATGRPYWATGTNGHGGSCVILQDDGNLVVYEGNTPLWASNTVQTWSDATGSEVPMFPIQKSQDNEFPGTGGFMHTDVAIYSSGLLNAVTHTWEVTDLRSFRGAVAVTVLDHNQLKLWVSPTQQYGVDGRWMGVPDRTDNWSAHIPAEVLPNVRYLAIIQLSNPYGIYNDIEHWLSGIENVTAQVAKIAQSVRTIIGASSGSGNGGISQHGSSSNPSS